MAFCFFFVGEVVERFVGVVCHVPWTRIRVKLELKNDFLKIKEIKMCLFCARSI